MAVERTFSIIKPNAVAKITLVPFMRVLKVLVSKLLLQKCCI